MLTALGFLCRLPGKSHRKPAGRAPGPLAEYDALVEKARQDWLTARSLFNNVCEPGLIDHAIFKLNAAERRYIFLLQEARRHQKNIGAPWAEKGDPVGE